MLSYCKQLRALDVGPTQGSSQFWNLAVGLEETSHNTTNVHNVVALQEGVRWKITANLGAAFCLRQND